MVNLVYDWPSEVAAIADACVAASNKHRPLFVTIALELGDLVLEMQRRRSTLPAESHRESAESRDAESRDAESRDAESRSAGSRDAESRGSAESVESRGRWPRVAARALRALPAPRPRNSSMGAPVDPTYVSSASSQSSRDSKPAAALSLAIPAEAPAAARTSAYV